MSAPCTQCPPQPGDLVDAARQPALRAALAGGAYAHCPACGRTAPGPALTYRDTTRGQWIAAFPYDGLERWREHEAEAQQRFAADPAAAGLRPRVVFGWAALRELLVAAEAGLDDVRLELLKLMLMRGMDPPPPLRSELRLCGIAGDNLALEVLDRAGAVLESLDVPHELIAQIESDPDGWAALRRDLTAGPFTDVLRLWRA